MVNKAILIRLRHEVGKEWLRQGLRSLHATTLRIASVVLALLFGIAGTRLVGVESFGDYVSLMTIAGFLSLATSVGLPNLITRELAIGRGRGDYTGLAAVGQLCLATLVLGVMALIGVFVLSGIEPILIVVFTVVTNLTSLLLGAHSGQERVIFASWVNGVVRPLVALICLLALSALLQSGTHIAVLAQIAGAVVATVVMIAAWRPFSDVGRAFRATVSASWWSPRHREVFRMALTFAASQILINATTQVDIIILTVLKSPEDVTHYFAAARAALVVSFFFGMNAAIAEPRIARFVAAGDLEATRKVIRDAAYTGVAMTLLSSFGCILLSRYYLALYGPTFQESAPALIILVAGLIGWSLAGPAQVTLRATRLDRALIVATLIALAINVALSLTLVPLLGITGAAVGTATQFIAYGAIMALISMRGTGLVTDVFPRGRPRG